MNPARGSAEDEEKAQDQQRRRRSFDGFQTGMIETLNRPDVTEAERRTALAIWFDVSTGWLCHRLDDIPGAIVFLRRWLTRTSETVRAASSPTEIERYTFTVVAILARFSKEADTTSDLKWLHETLERFCEGNVSREYAMAALGRDWARGLGGFLLGGEDPDLETNLRAALETRTTLTELQALLDVVREGKPVPTDSSLIFTRDGQVDPLGKDFLAALTRMDRSKHLRERRDGNFSVSCCNLKFSTAAAADYKTRRIAQCSMCKRFNLRLQP